MKWQSWFYLLQAPVLLVVCVTVFVGVCGFVCTWLFLHVFLCCFYIFLRGTLVRQKCLTVKVSLQPTIHILKFICSWSNERILLAIKSIFTHASTTVKATQIFWYVHILIFCNLHILLFCSTYLNSSLLHWCFGRWYTQTLTANWIEVNKYIAFWGCVLLFMCRNTYVWLYFYTVMQLTKSKEILYHFSPPTHLLV